MAQSGGFDAMSAEHQASAQQSYGRWAEDNPELGAKHGLRDYTSYVQGKEAERQEAAKPGNTNNTSGRTP